VQGKAVRAAWDEDIFLSSLRSGGQLRLLRSRLFLDGTLGRFLGAFTCGVFRFHNDDLSGADRGSVFEQLEVPTARVVAVR
jgi:hypothetical protein